MSTRPKSEIAAVAVFFHKDRLGRHREADAQHQRSDRRENPHRAAT